VYTQKQNCSTCGRSSSAATGEWSARRERAFVTGTHKTRPCCNAETRAVFTYLPAAATAAETTILPHRSKSMLPHHGRPKNKHAPLAAHGQAHPGSWWRSPSAPCRSASRWAARNAAHLCSGSLPRLQAAHSAAVTLGATGSRGSRGLRGSAHYVQECPHHRHSHHPAMLLPNQPTPTSRRTHRAQGKTRSSPS
jgi:hypothetical protein